MTYYSFTVPSNGYAQKLPSVKPSPQNPFSLMAITANATNSGPITVIGSSAILPGVSVTVGVEDPGALFLRGAAGDGIGFVY